MESFGKTGAWENIAGVSQKKEKVIIFWKVGAKKIN